MTKAQIMDVIRKNAAEDTGVLHSYINGLISIQHERELTKKMYFWSPGRSASDRRWHEDIRNIEENVQLKGLTVTYKRSYRETCHHVYSSDQLWSEEFENFDLRDVNKLIEGLKAVVSERSMEKEGETNSMEEALTTEAYMLPASEVDEMMM